MAQPVPGVQRQAWLGHPALLQYFAKPLIYALVSG